MFRRNRPRRRPFRMRRAIRALFDSSGRLAQEAREEFDEANDLYANAEYAQAAEGFAHLAEMAQQFSRPRRVVQLHLRAFEAWVKARQPAAAVQQARTAVEFITASGRPRVAFNVIREVLGELRAAGYHAEADALARDVNERLAGLGAPLASTPASAPAEPPPPKKFPGACPQCGGRLPRSFGEDEIECDYCGTVIRGE